ncbi:MAG: flavin prenyltransferase UbiX [Pirellulaceae bacterium]
MTDSPTKPLVVAVTGASGAIYAVRLLQVLRQGGRDVHLTVSPSAVLVMQQELGLAFDIDRPRLDALLDTQPPWRTKEGARTPAQPSGAPTSSPGRLVYHHYTDYMTPIASGSFLTAGMVVCPCSGSTLSGIAHGASNNLIQRAADVHLKERRRLVLVPRETPLSIVQLENMRRACEVGAVVLPAAPGWYHGVQSLDDLVDFVVARILDQLDIEHALMRRWGEKKEVT